MLFCAAGAVAACGEDEGPKVEYSVTVFAVDETPQKDVTVSWKQSGKTKGSAVTGEDGKASVKLPAGTYSVTLSGLDAGVTYTEISVTASMREIAVTLSVVRVNYTATVRDKNGANAKGVTVTWAGGGEIAGTADTDESGKAECELDYGDYTVTVSNLPAGNIFNGTVTASGSNPHSVIELINGESAKYSVTVRSEGGLKFADTTVFIYDSQNIPVHSGITDENGVLEFSLQEGKYTASVPTVQEGYTVKQKPQLTDKVRSGELVLASAVIKTAVANDKRYKVGDIINDFSFTTPYEVDGKKVKYTISELLKTKDAVVINNWGINCTYCVKEMPAMEEMYQKLKDKIEILAISNYMGGDSESAIVSHREAGYDDNGQRKPYTFPMMRDTESFYTHFKMEGWPTTVIVDRYGAIAHIESGAILEEEIWERLMNRFIGEDYVQTFKPGDDTSDSITGEVSKPDIKLPSDHYQKVAQAINSFAPGEDAEIVWSGETENEYIWPFVLKTEEGVSDTEVLCASNSKKHNSMAVIYGAVRIPVGKVLTFDYYSETESYYDIFSVVWDGKIIWEISGISNGWETCHLYTELTADTHMLAFAYKKDETKDIERDNVYIRNVRLENISDIESADMLRGAAYGVPGEKDTKFPHYAGVELAADGYYHVKLDSLQNSDFAGNDPSPMLFVNLTNVTNWNNEYSVNDLLNAVDEKTGDPLVDCNFTVNGVTRDYRDDLLEYCRVATASDIEGFMPVDKELYDLFDAFIKKAKSEKYHDKAWLEACYYFSHYGDGKLVGNPIIGLTDKTAIPAVAGTVHTADLTKVMAPFSSLIYTFTPETSAVYRIESLLPAGNKASQVWLYDDSTTAENPIVYDGDDRFIRDGENEQNFVVYRYMTAGHKYYIKLAHLMQDFGMMDFKITNVGQTATELVPTAAGYFNLIFDDEGNQTGIELAGTVDYAKDNEGYYHVKNADGSLGSYIYFDVQYPTRITPNASIRTLAGQWLRDPGDNTNLDYKVFDFRYRVAYYSQIDDAGDEVVNYNPKYDLTKSGIDRDFIDYTAIIQEYIKGAVNGLVKVDDRLIKIINLFIETRVNMLVDSDGDGVLEYEDALENEWLRFCWYNRTHNEQNP